MSGGGEDAAGGSRRDVEQLRYDVQAQLVAHDVGHHIRAVGDERLMLFVEPQQDILSRKAKQGPHDVPVARLDASEPVYARTPDEVHEKGLYGIVLMVSHTDVGSIDVAAKLLEIGIAQLSCCHFYADTSHRGIFPGVEVGEVQLDVKTLAEILDKILVALALVATQLEVAMHGFHLITHLQEHKQQADAVGTAADGNEIAAVGA